MKLLDNLKLKARILKKEITAIYYAYQNPKTNLLPKVIILFTLGYALSPIDLIPDFIPILGYLDDLIILPVLITLSIKLIPKDVMIDSRIKAEETPLQLKKNWLFASLFIIIWLFLILIIVFSAVKFIYPNISPVL
ncbi:MAG TPA: YkvA family protein [Spirochaetota bacterium]|nr:YkvA family protein [Spirochaetota bacterium]